MIVCSLSVSPYKSLFFLGLHDDDEALFSCLTCPILIATSNVLRPVLLLRIVYIIGISSIDSSSMKFKPSDDDDETDEEKELLSVEYLCI